MNQPLLSILIPTVVGREESLKEVVDKIMKSISGIAEIGVEYMNTTERMLEAGSTTTKHNVLGVEIIIITDNKEMTIGEKRELLYRKANGKFAWQIDDDDSIASDAIPEILQTIKDFPYADCITFLENCMMNGKYYSCNHSSKYDDWHDNHDGFNFVRTPFYKDVINTELARMVPFEKIRYGEDHAWSRAIKPLIKYDIHIDREIYFYIHNSKPEEHNERYGITQNNS